MNSADEAKFAKALHELAGVHGRQLTAGGLSIYFRVLEKYTWEEVSAAMSVHERDPQEGRFFPLPAHIIGNIRSKNKRPGADEMWAICPISEQDSVFWTMEAKAAFFQAALPLVESGDKIAARMAFKSAYDRLCDEADRHDEPVRWEFSPGFNRDGREKVLRQAINAGLLTNGEAQKLLPNFESPRGEEALPYGMTVKKCQ